MPAATIARELDLPRSSTYHLLAVLRDAGFVGDMPADDLAAGRWDGAEVRLWEVDWTRPADRRLTFRGALGEITHAHGGYRAELRGLAEALAARLLPAPPKPVAGLPGPRALFVVGSRDPITMPQVQALRRIGVALSEAPNGRVEPAPDADLLVVQAVPGTPPLPPAEVARLATTTNATTTNNNIASGQNLSQTLTRNSLKTRN